MNVLIWWHFWCTSFQSYLSIGNLIEYFAALFLASVMSSLKTKNRYYENVWDSPFFFFCDALVNFCTFRRNFNFSLTTVLIFKKNGTNGKIGCSAMCECFSLVSSFYLTFYGLKKFKQGDF